MKSLILSFAFLSTFFISIKVDAQIQKTNKENSGANEINTPLIFNASNSIVQFPDDFLGQNFNATDLSRLPYHNINSIANMVVGVNSNGGGTPNIKGAPASGTAYYVDGIRVYGALSLIR